MHRLLIVEKVVEIGVGSPKPCNPSAWESVVSVGTHICKAESSRLMAPAWLLRCRISSSISPVFQTYLTNPTFDNPPWMFTELSIRPWKRWLMMENTSRQAPNTDSKWLANAVSDRRRKAPSGLCVITCCIWRIAKLMESHWAVIEAIVIGAVEIRPWKSLYLRITWSAVVTRP